MEGLIGMRGGVSVHLLDRSPDERRRRWGNRVPVLWILLLASIPTIALASDWEDIPAGHGLILLQNSPGGFEPDRLVIPPGTYHFNFAGDRQEFILRKATGGHAVVLQPLNYYVQSVPLEEGEYEIWSNNPAISRGVLRLLVRKAGTSPYPTVIFTMARKSIRISTRRVVTGIVHLHILGRVGASFGLSDSKQCVLLFGTPGRVDVYLDLKPGRYSADDPVMGLESPVLSVVPVPKSSK
jgi:hypothetical protein